MTSTAPNRRIPIWKVLLPIGMIVLAVATALALIRANEPAKEAGADGSATASGPIRVGATLPDLELTRLDGSKVRISELPGKIHLINFWASWCEACLVEMPSIVELRTRYRDKGFEVLGINMDETPATAVPRITRQLKMEFPIFVDSAGEIGDRFDIHAIPLTVIVDKSRKVLLLQDGERNWSGSDIQAQIETWLSQQPS